MSEREKFPKYPTYHDVQAMQADLRRKRELQHAKAVRAKRSKPEAESKRAAKEPDGIDHPLLHSNEDIATLLLGLTAGRNAKAVRLGKHLFKVPTMVDIDTRYTELREDLEKLEYSPKLLASCKMSFKILKFWVERGNKAYIKEDERTKFIPNSALTDRHFEETIRSYEQAGILARIIAEQYGSGRYSSPAV